MGKGLEGLAVIEIGGGFAASSTGKALADLGAEVVKIEPPEGDPVRRRGSRSGQRDRGRRALPPSQCQQAKRGPRSDVEPRSGEVRTSARTGGPRDPRGPCSGAGGRGCLAGAKPAARGGIHHSLRTYRSASDLERGRTHSGTRRRLGLHHAWPGRTSGVAPDPPVRASRAHPGRTPRGGGCACRLPGCTNDRRGRPPRRIRPGDRRLPPRPALHVLRVRGAYRPPERQLHLRADGLLSVP